MSEISIVIASHSGYGHTAQMAIAVEDGARSVAGTQVRRVDVASLDDADWELMDAADAIIFGTPTYMGTASAAFHAFAEATSKRWSTRAWSDKLAAGFTNSGSMSGDKLHTLQYLSLLAAQHGMLWVSLNLLPGWNTTTSSPQDDNRLGFYLGVGAQSFNDTPDVHDADLNTARHLGRRVAEHTRIHRAGLTAAAH
ncbi:flavodoxin family protein [Streptomyces sp. NPDC090442]|uniref:flavodoxin family protein n=1 Tax=Streptomyces sp. NPDC090442 TaxID=3365962 RepID=UPI0037F49355